MYYTKEQIPTLTPSQEIMTKDVTIMEKIHGKMIPVLHKGMNTALCFQPNALHYDFKHGVARDEEGKFRFSSDGKAIMEVDVIKDHKLRVKIALQAEFSDNWKHAFQYPKLYMRSSRN